MTSKNTKIIKLLKKDIFKVIIFEKFIIFDKIFISNKFIIPEKISNNIQKYNFCFINKIINLYIYLILKPLLLSNILFNYIVKVIKLLYNILKPIITQLFIYHLH